MGVKGRTFISASVRTNGDFRAAFGEFFIMFYFVVILECVWMSEDNLWCSVLSLHHVGLRDWQQVPSHQTQS